MAVKRAKGEKSVLSRQDIASRKKALKQRRASTSSGGRRAILGVFVFALAMLVLLSVASWDVRDRVGPGFQNLVGPVGHALGELFRGVLGVCAFVLPVAGLYASAVMFVGGENKRRWPQLLCLGLLTVSTSVLAQLSLPSEGALHPPGGALGKALAEAASGLFSTVGTVILVSAVAVAALIVGTQFALLRLGVWAAHGLSALAEKARLAGLDTGRAALARWEEHRAQVRKAKEEEREFLAQLEADAHELEEAEAAANEADAAAELAAQEAFEADQERFDKEVRRRIKEKEREAREKERLAKKARAELEAAAAALPDLAEALGDGPPLAGEPAWAASLGAARRPADEAPKKKEPRKPNLITPPAPVETLSPAELKSLPPTAPPELPIDPPAAVGVSSPALSVALAPSPPAALAPATRTPVIIEPKSPPKPTKKKEQDQFEFVGDRKSFAVPPLSVLECDRKERSALDKEAFFATADKLRAKLADFGIVGEVVEIRPGPVVTMYEFLPGPGIKISKIASLADDLAMAMEAMKVRIVAPIPGKGVVGIEVPNRDRETVYLKEIAEQDAFSKSTSRLTMCLGKDIEGMPYVLDLGKAPHLLIAGTTGSGKSVAVNAMIMSILLKSTPEEVRFIMVDPKKLELSVYEGIPHLLLPVVTDPKKAALALRWAVEEMERRYQVLADAGVRNIGSYNKMVESSDAPKPADAAGSAEVGSGKKKKMLIVDVSEDAPVGVAAPKEPPEEVREPVAALPEGAEAEALAAETETEIRVDDESMLVDAALEATPAPEAATEEAVRKKLPYIVVIIDELADLMMVASREVETYIARLAQMARAAGIHLMVATQRPSTDVVTGVIKANFPTRISFQLRSKPDSMTILGTIGAEALLGMGDMLIMPPTSAHLVRVHGAFVSETEITRAVEHLKAQGKPVFDESILQAREEESEGGGEEDELSDELYDQALAVVAEMRAVSISSLQRKMRIGYNRAARMIERMERDGVVGPADGAKPREVLLRPVGDMPGAGAM